MHAIVKLLLCSLLLTAACKEPCARGKLVPDDYGIAGEFESKASSRKMNITVESDKWRNTFEGNNTVFELFTKDSTLLFKSAIYETVDASRSDCESAIFTILLENNYYIRYRKNMTGQATEMVKLICGGRAKRSIA